ncbi:MAG: ribonuclease [Blastocatellia bacterium]|jgi:ribonuclease G|nr:ribonuclease [Blastocatellia bacterium]
MSKELIVSVNGREKKIAIIENEQVSEFYIERGEENQGIVGNLYKGRVMRVLPGMQSAFVDIGLERDAFLYVSDFFDEEEEFERIVMDKKEKGDAAGAERAARERIEQARLEREQQIEASQERAEPLLDAEPETVAAIAEAEMSAPDEEDEAEETQEAAAQEAAPQATAASSILSDEEQAESGGKRRGRRGRRRGKGGDETEATEGDKPAERVTPRLDLSDIETPFVSGEASFERVVDEDERAAENGEMLKDAMLQERLFDQIHAIEFDMEEIPATEVGSLMSAGTGLDASFQRIDDSDIEADAQESETGYVQETVAAHVGAFIDEINEETVGAQSQSFERVSDDEQATEDAAATAAGSKAAKRGSTRSSSSSSSKKKPAAAATAKTKAASAKAVTEEVETETPATKRSSRKAAVATKTTTKKAAATKKSSSRKSSSKRGSRVSSGEEGLTDMAVLEGEATRAENADMVAAEAADGGHFEADTNDETFADAEASIGGKRTRGEMATRRGGRRRRRGGRPQDGTNDDGANGKDDEAEAIEIIEAPVAAKPAAPPPAKPAPAPTQRAAAPSSRERAPRPERSEPRGGRDERSSRDERGGREERSRDERGGRDERAPSGGRDDSRASSSRGPRSSGGGGGGSRQGRHQPMITDLLREGQEILVQIAKEPIAKKGARITSHIALPGRFLVYMPTVEHVGVSRKIESDSERVRLRKLIQAIRAEEDVPSGGFIVRTAGIGISEEDLRDDARYLVRTWLDIRRDAEKTKAPALAHRDLDLVQRILRDQLSDDFTAIRVDSEEEYSGIVEFINRIQPRMVKRVKLYTRETPILEAYGVQAEIEKAIKPRVWLRSGGYLVINQTEALVAIDVNTGKFVGRGGTRLEDTITRTNMEAVDEIVRQIRLRDLGGIIVLDLIDMEDRRNRNRVMQALQEALSHDKSPTKVLSFNDFGLVIMTRKRVKQSLERTICSPCPYCTGAGLVKSPQTVCYEILEEARRLARGMDGDGVKQTTLRINPEVARTLRGPERDVLVEIEDYLGAVDITSDPQIHQEQFDFAFI